MICPRCFRPAWSGDGVANGFVRRYPGWVPRRLGVGTQALISEAELTTLAVMAVILQFDNESRRASGLG